MGIGIAVPSPVDPGRPDHLSEIVLPDWQGESGFAPLLASYGVPVLVDNDANLGALAEGWWGAGSGVDDFAYVKIATGVGSRPRHRGPDLPGGHRGGRARSATWPSIPTADPASAASGGAWPPWSAPPPWWSGRARCSPSIRTACSPGRAVTLDTIVAAALGADALALRLVQETAEYLGIAVAGLLNLMNPSMVIFGGEVARLGELLLEPLRETIRRRTLVSSVAAAEVRMSALGQQAIAIGAATLVLDAALADPGLFPTAVPRREAG